MIIANDLFHFQMAGFFLFGSSGYSELFFVVILTS